MFEMVAATPPTHTPFIPYVKNNRIKLLISLQTIDFYHCQLPAFSYL
jgi:hypothetical protein